MGNPLAVYDSNAVDLILGVIPILDGRAEEFVTLEAAEEAYVTVVGADGKVTRCATNNRLYNGMIKLLGASEENQKLTALYHLDRNAANGAGIGAFLLKDNNGATLIAAEQCWITNLPAKAFGKTLADVEWPFSLVAPAGALFVGGN
jgi:hypothetical protein